MGKGSKSMVFLLAQVFYVSKLLEYNFVNLTRTTKILISIAIIVMALIY